MTASSHLPAPNLMPLMRYRELAEAMSWLEQAFGFEKQIAVSDNDGEVIYGQMTYRGSLIMMGAVRDTDLDKLMRQPDEVGGVETQSCYIVVDDADAHYVRSLDAGADIVLDIKSDGLGRRGYSCRDPQGHIWNFGTYNPGRGLASTAMTVVASQPASAPKRHNRNVLMSIGGLLLALGATFFWFSDEIKSDFMMRVADAAGKHAIEESERAYAELVKVRAEKRQSDERAKALNADLEAERARRNAIEANSGKATEQITEEQTARRSAEATIASLRDELKREREASTEAKRVSEEKLAVNSATQMPSPPKAETREIPAAPEQPATGASQNTSAASHDISQAAPPSGASDIETSATTATKIPAADIPQSTASVTKSDSDQEESASRLSDAQSKANERRPIKLAQKLPKQSVAKGNRIRPTYVVDLHEVPWPYNTWYK
ncbi:VOC family protein [Hyphomicrobium sp. LHD-15]|uniref:VOC family protein n=1 Tax=Hyphomicrobium sp. LHD-15 TaxID=3072142 RepID=UPI00280FCACC|nr:VOC family protein [Hyphomicrobium sp. LHD-15]MDQ8698063.1 hypothetical protein [Hyphomicrobium sp. LHD-15]